MTFPAWVVCMYILAYMYIYLHVHVHCSIQWCTCTVHASYMYMYRTCADLFTNYITILFYLFRKFQYQFKDSPIITRYSLRKRKKLIIKDSSGGNIDTGATAASNFMKRNGSSSQSELPFAFKSVVRKRKRSYKYINGAQYLSFTNGRSLKRIKNSQGTCLYWYIYIIWVFCNRKV